MNMLGNGLTAAKHYETAASVKEAQLSILRRIGALEDDVLITQGNLASTYLKIGRVEEGLRMVRDVYSGFLNLYGEENRDTLVAAGNYANLLMGQKRFEEAKALLRRPIIVARRFLGEDNQITLLMRSIYAQALYEDPAATLDDLREAVTTVEAVERIARRVCGGAHPLTKDCELNLQDARAALRARETPPPPS